MGDTVTEVDERSEMVAKGMTLAWNASQYPDRMAVISPLGDRTFGELNARANQLARAARRRGVAAGDGLALLLHNRPEFPEALNAAARTGLRSTPINWHLTGEEIAYILDDCEARVFVADARAADACAEAARLSPRLLARFAVGGPIDGFEEYDEALDAESPDDIEDPTEGAYMLYTSGTTGRPKGVRRPPLPIVVLPPDAPGAYRDGDVHLLTGPAYHAAPFAGSVVRPLALGVTVVMMDGWAPEETLRLVESHRVTHSHLVATMFHRLLALPESVRKGYDVSSLRWVNHGAAPCPVEVKKGMIEWWGPVIYEYYAATEGGGTAVTPEEWMERPGTVGRATPGSTVEVWDPDDKPCAPGTVGTIYFKAPAAGRFEYHKDASKTAGAYKGDYFTLGDLGYFDGDGYLFLTGRSADLIISGGVNIYPVEVDAALLQHPAVADVATIGAPNDEWGEEVKSVVQLKPGIEATPALADELVAFARERLAHYKCPRSIDFDEALPRQDSGKIYRRLVRDRYWQGRAKQI